MARYLDDPRVWRDRAEEARAHAEDMRDEESRRIMTSIAESYEKMAERAERRLAQHRAQG